MKSAFDKGMLICDLVVVSIWIFMTTWYGCGYSLYTLGVILPIAAARLLLSFGLYYRVEKISWAVIAFILIIGLFSLFYLSEVLDFFAVPYLKFLSCLWRFVTEQEGFDQPMFISHFIYNYDHGICPLWIYALSFDLFILFCGLPVFQAIWNKAKGSRENIAHTLWPWKKIIIVFFAYSICAAAIIAATFEYDYHARFSIYPKLALTIVLVGFISYAYYKGLRLTKIEKVYVMTMLLILIANEIGLDLNAWSSLAVMLVSSALILWYFTVKYKKLESKIALTKLITFVLVANILLWLMQFMTGTFKILALVVIVTDAIAVLSLLKRKEKLSLGWSLGVVVLTIGILPVLSLGYNPVACWNSEIVDNSSIKDGKYYGLMAVKSKEGFGLRDRYGYVLEPEYKSIEYMAEYSPLFLLETQKGKFGVYNITRGKFVADCKYSSIQPRLNDQGERQRVWNLVSNTEGEEIVEFLKWDRGWYIISDDPVQYSY